MRKSGFSIPLRIGLLLLVGLSVIFAGGYFTYTRLVKVVDTIHREKISEKGLPAIRYLTTSIEQAENYMRLYGITGNRRYLDDYNELTSAIDSSIQVLYSHYPDDAWFTAKIDTINTLFEHKKVLSQEMSRIWQQGASASDISNLTEEIRPAPPSPDSTRRLLARLFSPKKEEPTIDDEQLFEKLSELEQDEKQFENSLTRQEIQLAMTSNMISDAFLSLMAQLEEYEKNLEQENIAHADALANEAYRLMAALSIFGVVLGIFGLIILVGYIRKNQAYNRILEKSRLDAEDLAKSKELFIANVSHEIRTPLNAINGFIKQLISADVDREVKEKLKIVDSAGDQLVRLINDVLDFSKLQAGNLDLHPVHFKPAKVVSDACSVFSEMAASNHNIIETDVENVRDTVLFGDTRRFQQILYNLLSNSVKFTENGTIGVLATAKDSNDGRVVLEIVVTDTGLGIESSKLDKIFEEYSQADHDITIRYGGTGLGLSIVRKLVDLFNGDIRVESKKGIGTTVTCSLVFRTGDEAETTEVPDTRYELPTGLKVLVADDEVYNQELIAMILDKWEIRYDMAKNGLEAIEFLKKNRYDLVLMDIRMPVINGVTATRFIRETLNLSKDKLPVIGITADITRQQTEEASDVFNTLLVKPFSEKELYTALMVKDRGVPGKSEVNGDASPKGQQAGGDHDDAGHENRVADISGLVRVSGNDDAFVKEMISQFRESTMSGLEEIRDAVKKEEYTRVDDLAHRLAPPARHLNAKILLGALEKIRDEAKMQHGEQIIILVEEAGELAGEVVGSLRKQYEALNG